MRIALRVVVAVTVVAAALVTPAAAQSFVAPAAGTLYVQCVGGTGAAESQFGTGTSPENFKPLLSDLPRSCPTEEVPLRHIGEGDTIVFAIRTLWDGRVEWAFSNRTDRPSIVAFGDEGNALGMGGSVVQAIARNRWLLHLDDAASYLVDDNNNDFLIQLRFEADATGPGGK